MKYCQNCGERNSEISYFCSNCGQQLDTLSNPKVNSEPAIKDNRKSFFARPFVLIPLIVIGLVILSASAFAFTKNGSLTGESPKTVFKKEVKTLAEESAIDYSVKFSKFDLEILDPDIESELGSSLEQIDKYIALFSISGSVAQNSRMDEFSVTSNIGIPIKKVNFTMIDDGDSTYYGFSGLEDITSLIPESGGSDLSYFYASYVKLINALDGRLLEVPNWGSTSYSDTKNEISDGLTYEISDLPEKYFSRSGVNVVLTLTERDMEEYLGYSSSEMPMNLVWKINTLTGKHTIDISGKVDDYDYIADFAMKIKLDSSNAKVVKVDRSQVIDQDEFYEEFYGSLF